MSRPGPLRVVRLLTGDARAAVVRLAALTAAYALAEGATVGFLVPWLEALLHHRTGETGFWLAVLAGCVAVAWSARRAAELRAPLLSNAVRRALYDAVGKHVVRLPLGWFGPTRAAELEQLMGPGADIAIRTVTVAQSLLASALTPATVAVVLLVDDWRVGLVALVVTPVIPVAFTVARRLTDRADAETDRAVGEAGARLVEFADAQPVLRAYDRAGVGRALLDGALGGQYRAMRRALRRAMPGEHLGEVGVQLAFTAVVAAGLARVVETGLDPARGVAVMVLGLQLLRPVAAVVALAPSVRVCRAALLRIDAVLSAEPLAEPARSAPMGPPSVELRAVTFAYGPDGARVLDEIDLTVPAGSTTALVGRSGAGKSTVIRLIARFHDVTAGEVRVGGVDVRELTARDLARTVSLVPQDVTLFEGSILDNIRVGAPGADDDALRDAGRRARVDVVADRLPGGWDAPVGAGGSLLSGGERQRVAIARALAADTPIVLLDEPTSALDAGTELAVTEALAELGRDRTLLVVAHRLNVVAGADEVVVLRDGRVAERGDHAGLLARDGDYARMWEQQERARGWRLDATTS